MAVNIQTANGLMLLADKTTKQTIEAALGYTPANKDNLNSYLLKGDAQSIYATLNDLSNYLAKEEDGDSFSISDSAGHIILTVDKDGVHSVDFYVKDKSILEIIEEAGFSGDYNDLTNAPIEQTGNDDNFIIADQAGNKVVEINADGIQAVNVFVGAEKNEVALQKDLTELSTTINDNISKAIDDLNKDVEELVSTKSDVDHSHDSLISDASEFTITDSSGNIITKIDSTGLHAYNLFAGEAKEEVLTVADVLTDAEMLALVNEIFPEGE